MVDFAGQRADFLAEVGPLVRDGRIKYREHVVDGLENAPKALIGLLRGENFGKMLVRVSAEASHPTPFTGKGFSNNA